MMLAFILINHFFYTEEATSKIIALIHLLRMRAFYRSAKYYRRNYT